MLSLECNIVYSFESAVSSLHLAADPSSPQKFLPIHKQLTDSDFSNMLPANYTLIEVQ